MLVVSSELWVCALQARVSVCLWLLDAVVELTVSTSALRVEVHRAPRGHEKVGAPVPVSLFGLIVLRRVLGF